MLMIETMNNQNAKKMFKLEPKKQLITRKQPKPQNSTPNDHKQNRKNALGI